MRVADFVFSDKLLNLYYDNAEHEDNILCTDVTLRFKAEKVHIICFSLNNAIQITTYAHTHTHTVVVYYYLVASHDCMLLNFGTCAFRSSKNSDVLKFDS